jgi:hypothetical protein
VLKAYPFVYLVLSVIPLILRLHNAFTEEGDDVFALWILTVICAPLQGAVNAVVFGLDPDTRNRLTLPQIRLAWASYTNSAVIREYPTVKESTTNIQGNEEDVGTSTPPMQRHYSNSIGQRYDSM